MSDISLAVGDGSRRMTYAELANARGYRWPRPEGWPAAIIGIAGRAMTEFPSDCPPGPPADNPSANSGRTGEQRRTRVNFLARLIKQTGPIRPHLIQHEAENHKTRLDCRLE